MSRNRTFDIPFFYQKKDQWCGPGATKIFLKVYHPGQIHLRRLARLIGVNKEDGTYSKGIIRACRAYGQDVRTKEQATYEDLEQCLDERIPAMISYLEPVDPDGHYAVVTGLTERHIWLHDPYYGPFTKYKRIDFTPRWRYYRKWMMWPVWPDVLIDKNLRFFRQGPNEWVGAGALLIMLKMYQSRHMRAQELARIVHARRHEMLTASSMIKIARQMGLNVESMVHATRADIKWCLDRNIPAIICYRSPKTEGV
ncbi:MAG: papain-like cysteine protease family protein [Saprospiraceae bacterium]|nr:papain-like cysteine protease family protein [Saprospiraceae bacterium]